jgi:hypothetical protein
MEVELEKYKIRVGKFQARCFIGEELVSEVKFTVMSAKNS